MSRLHRQKLRQRVHQKRGSAVQTDLEPEFDMTVPAPAKRKTAKRKKTAKRSSAAASTVTVR